MKIIKLSNGSKTVVDNDDYTSLSLFKWHLHHTGYACRNWYKNGKTCHESMHRRILKTPKGLHSDHINGNKLDNRKSNLRICTQAENRRNSIVKRRINASSKYIGVVWDKTAKRWRSRIWINGKHFYLGLFKNEEEAGKAYMKAKRP